VISIDEVVDLHLLIDFSTDSDFRHILVDHLDTTTIQYIDIILFLVDIEQTLITLGVPFTIHLQYINIILKYSTHLQYLFHIALMHHKHIVVFYFFKE